MGPCEGVGGEEMKINSIACDNCHRLKGETNHWWIIEYNEVQKSMFISPLESNYLMTIMITTLPQAIACSYECLNIMESKIREGKDPRVPKI